MDWKKLLFPPVWLTVILVIVSALALTYVFVNGLEQSVLAYMVYILAFYSLVAASVFLAETVCLS